MTDHPIKFKPSKHADFMQAAKVHTPKYKFYVEVGGDPTHPTIVLIMGLGAQSLVWPNEFCYALINAGFRVVRFDNRDIGKSSKLKHKKLTQAHDSFIYKAKLLGSFGLGLPLKNLQTPYDLYDMANKTNSFHLVMPTRLPSILRTVNWYSLMSLVTTCHLRW